MSLLDSKTNDAKTRGSLETFIYKQLLQSAGLDKGLQGMAGMVFTDVLSEAIAKSSPALLPPLPGEAPAAHPGSAPGVTSGFGARKDPFTGELAQHEGVDVAAEAGTPISAAWDGKVVSAGERGGYGNAVEVDHGNGVHTLYAHASELEVKPGDVVKAGDKLGEVGSTGRSTGPHLHLELRVNGKAADPTAALKAYRNRAEGDQ
ncbi:MAG: M23 family metallopeptidase [Archangiaceae bacterium]|nr:M23 family metallopeptidase [Archangiaceae bacterium]